MARPEMYCSSGPLNTSTPASFHIWMSCTGMEEFFTATTRGFFCISFSREGVRATPASWGML